MSEHGVLSDQQIKVARARALKAAHRTEVQVLEEILIEQRQTNQLLALLIEALADEADHQDEEGDPTTYLDGTPRS